MHELSKRLAEHFQVTVIGPHALGAKRDEFMDEVRVLRYRYAPAILETLVNNGGIVTNLRRAPWKWLLVPGFLSGQWWSLRRLIRSVKPDLIHAHWLIPQGFVACLASKRVPFVVTSHGADLFALKAAPLRALKRHVVRRATAVTVVSATMRDELACVGIDIAKVRVQPMGVDLSGRFVPDPRVERSRDEILFVGRLVEKKGLHYLIDAMPGVLEAHPGAHLTIAGFGPELAKLQAKVRRLGLEAKVRFSGAIRQADLPRLYQRAAVFVAPFIQTATGDQEGLGLVSVEAAGCACPVVVSDLPAVRQVFPEDDMVSWAQQRDAAALGSQILYVLQHPERARERAIATGKSVAAQFDWSIVAAEYSRLLLMSTAGTTRE
ncbi:MAG: glycosyltransferase [Rhodanobacteraceae bacterium]